MDFKRFLILGLLSTQLAACGGAGNVSGYSASRGISVEREDTDFQVRTLARATAFDRESGISTRGIAEVIYRAGGWGQRTDRGDFVPDALARARAVSRCETAVHSHSQDSLQGVHVMITLSDCPPVSRR